MPAIPLYSPLSQEKVRKKVEKFGKVKRNFQNCKFVTKTQITHSKLQNTLTEFHHDNYETEFSKHRPIEDSFTDKIIARTVSNDKTSML